MTNDDLTVHPEIFTLNMRRDIDEQLIQVTNGNGVVKCSVDFFPCASGVGWVVVGPVAENVLAHPDLVPLLAKKWPKRFGVDVDVYSRNLPRIRSFLRKLNTLAQEPVRGATPDDVRFFMFSTLCRILIPEASVKDMADLYANALKGAKLAEHLLRLGRRLRPITPGAEVSSSGLLDAALSPANDVAYGNTMRSVAWGLHYMLMTGVSRVNSAFVREVLRVRPPSAWPRRRAIKPVRFLNFTIPEGDAVYVSIRATNLAIGGSFTWPVPERESLAFGAGPHRCPVKIFSENALIAILNGPGPRPVSSTEIVNQAYPDQVWL